MVLIVCCKYISNYFFVQEKSAKIKQSIAKCLKKCVYAVIVTVRAVRLYDGWRIYCV